MRRTHTCKASTTTASFGFHGMKCFFDITKHQRNGQGRKSNCSVAIAVTHMQHRRWQSTWLNKPFSSISTAARWKYRWDPDGGRRITFNISQQLRDRRCSTPKICNSSGFGARGSHWRCPFVPDPWFPNAVGAPSCFPETTDAVRLWNSFWINCIYRAWGHVGVRDTIGVFG